MGKEGYPGNLITFVENMAGWRNTYNHETWFLLPYSLLALSATCLFRISNQMKPWLLFLIVFSIYLIVRFLSRFDGGLIRNYQLLRWLESFLTLLFPFMLGMFMAKYVDFKKLRHITCNIRAVVLSMLVSIFVVIIMLRDCFQSFFYPFYVLAFILLFVLLQKPIWLLGLLKEFGKRSTSIWFVHTYLCYYLFQDYIYGLKYPVLIFVVLAIISYLISVAIDFVNRKIDVYLKL